MMTGQRQQGSRHANHHPDSWRERLLSLATVTATALLIWIWASGQTRQSAEANCRIHFLPAASDSQSVGPEDPISVRVQFSGSKSAVEDAVNAVNGRVFDIVVGTTGVPNTPGGHEVSLAEVIAAMPLIEESGVLVRSVQPSIANVAIEAVVRSQARVLVRTASGAVIDNAVVEPATVSIWVPEPLVARMSDPCTVDAIVPTAPAPGVTVEVPVTLPAELATTLGRARMEPTRVRVRTR
jgi:hypothetical protein